MTTARAARLRLMMVVALLAAGIALGFWGDGTPAPAFAAQKEQPGAKKHADPTLPKGSDDAATSFLACAKCHNEKPPVDIKGNIYAQRFQSHHFVLFSEGRTWTAEDPHSAAFKVLEGPLGKQMTTILGKGKKGYSVTTDARCLTCHAIDMNPLAPLPAKVEQGDPRFDTTDGVTCNACHGLRKPWQQEHFEDKPAPGGGRTIPWRTMTPEYKEQAGMRNLRDPVVKAKLCASCHVGDPDLNRVVTHDMYAAGHPPLPPFELGSYMEAEPKHWGYPINPDLKFFTEGGFKAYTKAEKLPEDWTWKLYRFHPEGKEVYLARQLTAGAVASLHAEMKLLAADAEAVTKGDEGSVDFARFDCYACHHDLKYPSDRQARGYAGPPGRPPLKAWTAALPGVVVEHATTLAPFAEKSKDFRKNWDAVQTAALARPFGRPREVATAANNMAEWCEDFMRVQSSEVKPLYTQAEAEKLLGRIGAAAVSKEWIADPEAAMHLSWAYIALRKHMKMGIDEKALDDLRPVLPVAVREPRKEGMYKGTYSNDDGNPLTVGDTLRQRLDLFNKFNSKDFTRTFGNISGPPKK